MATTIINPAPANNTSDNSSMFLVGTILAIVFAVLFFVYALPFIRGLGNNTGVQVNIPKSIDVNVKQSK